MIIVNLINLNQILTRTIKQTFIDTNYQATSDNQYSPPIVLQLSFLFPMQKQQISDRHHKFNLTLQQFSQHSQSLLNFSFDKYCILTKIGQGSFATVYRGILLQTKHQVAIKVINMRELKLTPNPKLKQIKLRLASSESRIMMLFDSPNILKCYECFESDDFKFMILQYCNGNDLATKIQKQSKIFEDEAVDILKQIVNGIGECHKKKIIHRDLKPQNIMVHNGIYKLADFGFSKLLQIQGENQTCFNTTLGTPTTMAPEVRNFQPYGLKADIWSIGVIFYNMLFGKCPFESRGNHNKIALRITQNLTKEEFYQGIKVSDKARKFLRQVLVVDPEKRLGWRDLIEHQIFVEQEEMLKSSYGRQVSIMMRPQEMQKLEELVIVNRKSQQHNQKQQQQDHTISSILESLVNADSIINQLVQENQQLTGGKEQGMKQQIKMRQCSSRIVQSTEFNMKQIDQLQIRAANDQQMQLYQWAKRTYLDCLKTELICKKILLPIQTHHLLDLSARKPIEFLYLLSTRCYNNLSPLYVEYQHVENSQIMQQLTFNMQTLYKDVSLKWQRYSYLLTEKENQKIQIVTDFAKKIVNIFSQAYDFHKRQKFMAGIESMGSFRKSYEVQTDSKMQKHTKGHTESDPSLKDYTKDEQVHYTQDYFTKVKSKFLKSDSQQCKQVIKHLQKFTDICNVSLEDLKTLSFKQFVQKLVQI